MFVLAAFSLGLLGSFHCIGMCGPIALAVPIKRTSSFSIIFGSIAYNLGRVCTYSLMGLFFGYLGQGLVFVKWQNAISIFMGILILIFLLITPFQFKLHYRFGFYFQFLNTLKSRIKALFSTSNFAAILSIGLLNGLLPCGLVYLGIAGSISTGNAIEGAVFMLFFGIGTFPLMMVIPIISDYISIRFRETVRNIMPLFVGIMAIMLILRGMNLGIPLISPSVQTTNNGCSHLKCCNK